MDDDDKPGPKYTPGLLKTAKLAMKANQDTFRHQGKDYKIEACKGGAHTNAHQDHCGRCAPLWEKIIRFA